MNFCDIPLQDTPLTCLFLSFISTEYVRSQSQNGNYGHPHHLCAILHLASGAIHLLQILPCSSESFVYEFYCGVLELLHVRSTCSLISTVSVPNSLLVFWITNLRANQGGCMRQHLLPSLNSSCEHLALACQKSTRSDGNERNAFRPLATCIQIMHKLCTSIPYCTLIFY